MMSGEYPHGCFMQLGLKPLPSQVVEVEEEEFDNHSLLGEEVWGEGIRSPCLKGGGEGEFKPKPPFHVACRGTADQFERKRLSIMKSQR